MDHLNHRLNELGSRLDHLERLALQLQRDNNLKHEELKQYISATFNLINSSINAHSNTVANQMKNIPAGFSRDLQRANGSASFDLLVPANTSPYLGASALGSDSLNGNQQQSQQQNQQAPHYPSNQQAQQIQAQQQSQQQQQQAARGSIFNAQLTPQIPSNDVPGSTSHQHPSQGRPLHRFDQNAAPQQPQAPNGQEPPQQPPQQDQQKQNDSHRESAPPNAQQDNSNGADGHSQIPLITIKRSLATVEDIWREYYYGLEGNPSIRSLDAQYGRLWRDKQKERTYFRRKKIFGFIERYMDFYNCGETQAIQYLEDYRKDEQTGKKKTLMWLYTHMPTLPNEV